MKSIQSTHGAQKFNPQEQEPEAQPDKFTRENFLQLENKLEMLQSEKKNWITFQHYFESQLRIFMITQNHPYTNLQAQKLLDQIPNLNSSENNLLQNHSEHLLLNPKNTNAIQNSSESSKYLKSTPTIRNRSLPQTQNKSFDHKITPQLQLVKTNIKSKSPPLIQTSPVRNQSPQYLKQNKQVFSESKDSESHNQAKKIQVKRALSPQVPKLTKQISEFKDTEQKNQKQETPKKRVIRDQIEDPLKDKLTCNCRHQKQLDHNQQETSPQKTLTKNVSVKMDQGSKYWKDQYTAMYTLNGVTQKKYTFMQNKLDKIEGQHLQDQKQLKTQLKTSKEEEIVLQQLVKKQKVFQALQEEEIQALKLQFEIFVKQKQNQQQDQKDDGIDPLNTSNNLSTVKGQAIEIQNQIQLELQQVIEQHSMQINEFQSIQLKMQNHINELYAENSQQKDIILSNQQREVQYLVQMMTEQLHNQSIQKDITQLEQYEQGEELNSEILMNAEKNETTLQNSIKQYQEIKFLYDQQTEQRLIQDQEVQNLESKLSEICDKLEGTIKINEQLQQSVQIITQQQQSSKENTSRQEAVENQKQFLLQLDQEIRIIKDPENTLAQQSDTKNELQRQKNEKNVLIIQLKQAKYHANINKLIALDEQILLIGMKTDEQNDDSDNQLRQEISQQSQGQLFQNEKVDNVIYRIQFSQQQDEEKTANLDQNNYEQYFEQATQELHKVQGLALIQEVEDSDEPTEKKLEDCDSQDEEIAKMSSQGEQQNFVDDSLSEDVI